MSQRDPASAAARTGRHPIQLAATVVAAVFLLVGILGFIPGVTTNYEQLSLAGHGSGALLLGVFAVSVLHNLVHAAFGVAGLVLARTATGARNFLIWAGSSTRSCGSTACSSTTAATPASFRSTRPTTGCTWSSPWA
jgi:hypothetical protein